jgi:hypothetical protein
MLSLKSMSFVENIEDKIKVSFDRCLEQISRNGRAEVENIIVPSAIPQSKSLQTLVGLLKEFARIEQTLYKLGYIGKNADVIVYHPQKTTLYIIDMLNKIQPCYPLCKQFGDLLRVRIHQAKLYQSLYDNMKQCKGNGVLSKECNFLSQFNTSINQNDKTKEFISNLKECSKSSPLYKYAKLLK